MMRIVSFRSLCATTRSRPRADAPTVIKRRRASFAYTSNRSLDEWLGLFDDPILDNSAFDRLANSAH